MSSVESVSLVERLSIGTRFTDLTTERISRTHLAMFAGASGDHNPIHIDLDVARSAGLDDVFAHGMLLMAQLSRLLVDTVPQSRLRDFAVRFAAVTPVNARPTATGIVTSMEEVDGEQVATVELNVTLQDGTVVLTGDAKIVVT